MPGPRGKSRISERGGGGVMKTGVLSTLGRFNQGGGGGGGAVRFRPIQPVGGEGGGVLSALGQSNSTSGEEVCCPLTALSMF